MKVLFVCVHNSARSQMAEELLRICGGEHFDVDSAGLAPGELNPFVVEALKEEGLDIRGKKTRGVEDLMRQKKSYDYVITVCDEASAEQCPVFPGDVNRLHWSFPDPSKFTGSEEEILHKVREVRDDIKEKIQQWLESQSP